MIKWIMNWMNISPLDCSRVNGQSISIRTSFEATCLYIPFNASFSRLLFNFWSRWVIVSHVQTFSGGLTRSQFSQWRIYDSHSNATITCWYLLSPCQIVQQSDLQQSWPSLVWPRGKRWERLGICLAPSGSIQHMPQCHSCMRKYVDRYGTVYSRRNNFGLKGVVLMSMLTWWPKAFRCQSFSL